MAGVLYPVAGDQYRVIDQRILEIKRQLNQKGGSPLDPVWVSDQLQRIVEYQPIILPAPITGECCDLRVVQASLLWSAGFGRDLGIDTFDAYLATIPSVPTFPDEYAGVFDKIVLVDTRLSLTVQCRLLGVTFNGNDETFVDFDPNRRPTQRVYWMNCQDGKRNLNKKVRTCRQKFQSFEVGLTAIEGLAIFAQDRTILKDHFMDLPSSVHRGVRGHAAYLYLSGGGPYLVHDWDDDEDPSYGSSSRGECVV